MPGLARWRPSWHDPHGAARMPSHPSLRMPRPPCRQRAATGCCASRGAAAQLAVCTRHHATGRPPCSVKARQRSRRQYPSVRSSSRAVSNAQGKSTPRIRCGSTSAITRRGHSSTSGVPSFCVCVLCAVRCPVQDCAKLAVLLLTWQCCDSSTVQFHKFSCHVHCACCIDLADKFSARAQVELL